LRLIAEKKKALQAANLRIEAQRGAGLSLEDQLKALN
jgi:hypothetical protein